MRKDPELTVIRMADRAGSPEVSCPVITLQGLTGAVREHLGNLRGKVWSPGARA